ncbi:hypothetical protein NHQ30_011314 [Ciborinia camelliae]|nr:hypothetical protein NHQ30_011314 [Ciborinia camelliae]
MDIGMNDTGPGPLPPFGRGNSPRPEVRPIMRANMASPKACPDYKKYSTFSHHEPLSDGPMGLPFQRPVKQCRTFSSPLVEKVIDFVRDFVRDWDGENRGRFRE